MKKIIALAVFAAMSAHAADALRFSTDGGYPPFSETNDKGEMIGFDIDIGKALCAEMKRECTFEQTDWDGLIPALKTNKIDVILASMNANEERRQSIAFTDPYYVNPGIFVRAKGNAVALSEEGLKGKVIGVLRASVFDSYATDKYEKMATIQRYTSQEEANLDAVAGRVDVLFADKLVLEDGFLRRDEGKDFEAFGEEVNEEKYFGEGISIGVRKEDEQLRADLNAALKAILENGEYKKVNDKYFPYDISGGLAK
ncbi:MAG: transporter substrate-binding domain-containing protein [Cardiobacteriaceae bacterium]|nr:transporter substrate-binding domain-containing protein [Cardiobacteriaceae bacterium]